jgi:hypothetical protein
MARREELTDEQWMLLAPLIPATTRRSDGRGRPEVHSDRAVERYSTESCGCCVPARLGPICPTAFLLVAPAFGGLAAGSRPAVMRQMLEAQARHLEETGQIDLSECFIDGTFVVAKKGDPRWERPKDSSQRFEKLLRPERANRWVLHREPNDAVEKGFLTIFVRCKSLIYIEVKIDKIAFLDFFYSLNAVLTSTCREAARSLAHAWVEQRVNFHNLPEA